MAKNSYIRRPSSTLPADADLGVKLILFEMMQDDAPLAALGGKMLLTSEDERGSDYVFGYIINHSLPQRLRSFLKRSNATMSIPEAEQFKQIFDAAAEGFGAWHQEELITFLVRGAPRLNTPNEQILGPFTAYSCETAAEIAQMLPLIEGYDNIALCDLTIIERSDLVFAINHRMARMRDADADIVFNKSAFMRTTLAFPPKPDSP